MTDPPFLAHRGCKLAYGIRGEGPPVLLIQGVAVRGDAWLPQVDALAERHRCLWFDNRGMARSQPLGAQLTVAQMAEDALALMDAQGFRAAHVVGHSLGGLVAQHLALTARERVRSLSLLCTFARGRDVTLPAPRAMWLGLRTRLGSRRMRRRAFLEIVMPPDVLATGDVDALAERLAARFGHDLADPPPVATKQMAAMHRYDATPRLGELAGVPTLVVSALHDPIAPPRLGRALAAGIPGARYVQIDDASHGVPLQCADRINALLLDHFAEVPPAP
ncbi:alpha/beta fold hydrolase [Chondromyces apiculatus]|uniref:Alpha/beta hydrolase fold protein n=1 Tax=Chondromyces apiculatus DSM 436 TaxID=1192034 RepID=A0A017TC34_9BACT|nr:alpha/beta fold hydrolase [Chondromyces apiculatus]EYF06848.1 alpha/beta hydrolase fold protein [Chondromyces apiculatus DSM 436]